MRRKSIDLEKQLLDMYKRKLKNIIEDTLKNEVDEAVVDTMQINIQTKVYNAYDPVYYLRTERLINEKSFYGRIVHDDFTYGGLTSSYSVQNTRRDDWVDEKTGDFYPDRYIPEIIEYGHKESQQKYIYPTNYDFLRPRPFIEASRQDLRRFKEHVFAMEAGLKSRGLKVKRS